MEKVRDIVDKVGKEKMVERIMASVIGVGNPSQLPPQCRDLCQMVYLILLESPKNTIDSYEQGCFGCYVRKIISNQYFSKTSPFYAKVDGFRKKAVDMDRIISRAEEDEGTEGIDLSYLPGDEGVMPELMEIVKERLPAPDRILKEKYAEFGSYRELARRMNLGASTVWKQIRRVRRKIWDEYERMNRKR